MPVYFWESLLRMDRICLPSPWRSLRGIRNLQVQKRALILLHCLPGLLLAVSLHSAGAQEALLRGVDLPVDQPATPRRRAQPVAAEQALQRDSVRGLSGRSVRGSLVSPKLRLPRPQEAHPNTAVIAPIDAGAVAPGLDPGVAPRPRLRGVTEDPFLPAGTRIGNIRIDFSDEIQGGYDDNTARASGATARRPSAFVREGAELRLRSDWSQHEFSGEASGGYSWYPNAREANRPDAQMRFGLRLDAARDTQIDLETRGRIDTQQPNSPDLAVTPAERPLVYNYGTSAGVTQRFSRLSVGLTGALDRTSYENVRLGAGSILDQSRRDLNDYGLRLRTAYELKPGLTPFLEASTDNRRYDSRLDEFGFERSSLGAILRAGTSFEITRLLTGEISAGYGGRDYDDARLSSLRGPVADASIVWAATPLTTLTLRGASTFDETTLANSSGAIARRVSLDLNHQLLRNLALGANFAITDTRYKGIDRNDQVLTGLLRAEYRLNRILSARLSYTHERSLSNVANGGYTSNIWLIGIKASL